MGEPRIRHAGRQRLGVPPKFDGTVPRRALRKALSELEGRESHGQKVGAPRASKASPAKHRIRYIPGPGAGARSGQATVQTRTGPVCPRSAPRSDPGSGRGRPEVVRNQPHSCCKATAKAPGQNNVSGASEPTISRRWQPRNGFVGSLPPGVAITAPRVLSGVEILVANPQ